MRPHSVCLSLPDCAKHGVLQVLPRRCGRGAFLSAAESCSGGASSFSIPPLMGACAVPGAGLLEGARLCTLGARVSASSCVPRSGTARSLGVVSLVCGGALRSGPVTVRPSLLLPASPRALSAPGVLAPAPCGARSFPGTSLRPAVRLCGDAARGRGPQTAGGGAEPAGAAGCGRCGTRGEL